MSHNLKLNDFQAFEIDEASNYAQDKATEYVQKKDENATVEVDDGEVNVLWSDTDDNFPLEETVAQNVFDHYFEQRLHDILLARK